jgi:dihydropyrimidinase
MKVKGLPRFVLTRGKLVVEEDRIDVRPGHGEFVAREPNPAVHRALSQWKELVAPRPVQRGGIPASGV